MQDFLDAINSLGAKVTLSLGTLVALIVGLFTLNRKTDERIDIRARNQAIDEIQIQHETCKRSWEKEIADCFERSDRMGRMEERMTAIDKSLTQLLNIHLHGGRRNEDMD